MSYPDFLIKDVATPVKLHIQNFTINHNDSMYVDLGNSTVYVDAHSGGLDFLKNRK